MRRLIFILCAMIGVSQAQTIQYIGAPTTTVISRGNFRTDSIFYLPKRTKAPTDTAALRYQISDSTVYVWTGSQWVKAGGGVGSLTGSGVAGYMPEFTTTTNLDTTRLYHSAGRFAIGNTNITNGVFNVYGGLSYFDTTLRVGVSTLYVNESNGRIGIGTLSPSYNLDISGTARIDTTVYLGKGNIDNQSLIKLPGSYELLYKQNVSTFDGFILDSSFGNHFFFRATEGRQHQSFYIGDAQTTQNAFGFATFDSTDNFWKARIAINQNGNTGINTNAPAYDLDVNGTLRTVNGAIFASTIGEILMGTTSDVGDYRLQVSGKIYNTGDAVFGLNSGSNVTIGTVTPAYNATGRGNLTINGLDAILSFKVSDANAGYIYHNATNLLMNNALNGGIIFLTNNGENARINAAGELILSTTGSDLGNYRLQVTGNIISDGHITTGGPTGGSAKTWKLGEAASVTPTSPNRTIRVEIDGTVYYLHAKTTND